jgi:hypothetical protein
MILLEVFPIILSVILLAVISIRKSFWESKVTLQMSRIEHINKEDIKHVVAIVDDISTSVGFLGAIISILFGIILIIIGEILDSKTVSFGSIKFVLLLSLVVIYISALILLYSMKAVLLREKCRTPFFQWCSYASLFNGLVYIGYGINIIIILIRQYPTQFKAIINFFHLG